MELASVFLCRSKIEKLEIFITDVDTMTSLRILVRVFGQCSEICGANHRFMPIVIERVSTNQFIN